MVRREKRAFCKNVADDVDVALSADNSSVLSDIRLSSINQLITVKLSNKRPRRLLEHWPRVSGVYYCYLFQANVNFTLHVNFQHLHQPV